MGIQSVHTRSIIIIIYCLPTLNFKEIFINPLLRTLKQNMTMDQDDTWVVVAVSGGMDSLALLHAMKSIRKDLNLQLHIATLDHQLRPTSVDDVAFVQHIADEWNLPVTIGRADVAALATEKSQGIELAAREARYRFFAGVAQAVGARYVVTAHHAGDQAETILMRILRGTGVEGLGGMALDAPMPYAPALRLLRPLLTVPRAAIREYSQIHQLEFREDASNLDERYTRNHIRHTILPILENINPNIEAALNRLGDIMQTDQAYINMVMSGIMRNAVSMADDRIYIDREKFRELHSALQRRCIIAVLDTFVGTAQQHATYDHILHAVDLGQRGTVGMVAQLPGGIQLRVDYNRLVVEASDAPPLISDLSLEPGTHVRVTIPGVTPIPGRDWSLVAHLAEKSRLVLENACQLRLTDLDDEVLLRTRQPGDRISPPGLRGHTQKLKDWLINRKISRIQRDHIPLLTVNGQIVAILLESRWEVLYAPPSTVDSEYFVNFFINYS